MSYYGDMESEIREKKVCFLGDAEVGKSSLLLRFVSGTFNPNLPMTIGASSFSKSITIDNEIIKFDIWDTAGQERFKTLAPMYYRRVAAAIIVYDITSRDSFNYVKNWVNELKKYEPNCSVIAIVGNKCDLEERREVPTKVGENYSEGINALFIEASALTPQNVDEIFFKIGRALVPSSLQPSSDETLNVTLQQSPFEKVDLNEPAKRKRQGSCC